MKKYIHYFTKAELALWGSSTALMIVFSLLYGVISYTCAYYGEMITYLGMTAPMALFALISFLMFLANDLYGSASWKRMEKRQLQMA